MYSEENFIQNLPDELIEKIFKFLLPRDFVTNSTVCKRFYNILNHQAFEQKLTFKFEDCIIAEGYSPFTTFENSPRCIRNLHLGEQILIGATEGGEEGNIWKKIGKNIEMIKISGTPGGEEELSLGFKVGLPKNILTNFPNLKTIEIDPKTIERHYVIPQSVNTFIFDEFPVYEENDYFKEKNVCKASKNDKNVKEIRASFIKYTRGQRLSELIQFPEEFMDFLQQHEGTSTKFKIDKESNLSNWNFANVTNLIFESSPRTILRAPVEYWNKFTSLVSLCLGDFCNLMCFLMHKTYKLPSLTHIEFKGINYQSCILCVKMLKNACPELKNMKIQSTISTQSVSRPFRNIFTEFKDILQEISLNFDEEKNYNEVHLTDTKYFKNLQSLTIRSLIGSQDSKISMEFCKWIMPNLSSLKLTHQGFEDPNLLRNLVRNTPRLKVFSYKQARDGTFPEGLFDVMNKSWKKLKEMNLVGVRLKCSERDCFSTKCALLFKRGILSESHHKALKCPCSDLPPVIACT